jgi:hypothetical protein
VVQIFISHASEDKNDLARPLAEALRSRGVTVWFDEFTLKLGDNLRRSIDAGLKAADYGVVILSPAFFAKEWPQLELDGLWAREASDGRKVILPILHRLTIADVLLHTPMLAGKIAVSSTRGLDYLVAQIMDVVERQLQLESTSRTAHEMAPATKIEVRASDNTPSIHRNVAGGCSSFGRFYLLVMTGAIFFAFTAAFMLTKVDRATFWKVVDFNTHLRSSWLGESIIALFVMVLLLLATIAVVRKMLKRYGLFIALYSVVACCCLGYVLLCQVSFILIPENPWAQHPDIVAQSALSAFLTVIGLIAIFHLIYFWTSLPSRRAG